LRCELAAEIKRRWRRRSRAAAAAAAVNGKNKRTLDNLLSVKDKHATNKIT
jgi:hypothetical protein